MSDAAKKTEQESETSAPRPVARWHLRRRIHVRRVLAGVLIAFLSSVTTYLFNEHFVEKTDVAVEIASIERTLSPGAKVVLFDERDLRVLTMYLPEFLMMKDSPWAKALATPKFEESDVVTLQRDIPIAAALPMGIPRQASQVSISDLDELLEMADVGPKVILTGEALRRGWLQPDGAARPNSKPELAVAMQRFAAEISELQRLFKDPADATPEVAKPSKRPAVHDSVRPVPSSESLAKGDPSGPIETLREPPGAVMQAAIEVLDTYEGQLRTAQERIDDLKRRFDAERRVYVVTIFIHNHGRRAASLMLPASLTVTAPDGTERSIRLIRTGPESPLFLNSDESQIVKLSSPEYKDLSVEERKYFDAAWGGASRARVSVGLADGTSVSSLQRLFTTAAAQRPSSSGATAEKPD